MQKISEEQWSAIKQNYPIDYNFLAKVLGMKPCGIFFKIERSHHNCIGSIEIVQASLFRKITCKLPFDYSKRPQEGTEINCIVCYDNDRDRQLDLGWLCSKSN